MDSQIMIITIAVFAFGFTTLVVGNRIGELDSRCNLWLEKTTNPKNIPDRISQTQIFTLPDKIIIEGDYQISEFVDSNSMLPTLDYGSNGIQVELTPDMELQVGDIISYDYYPGNYSIVHRIVDIKHDEKGIYYVTKGDNKDLADPIKVRRDQIRRVTVGVLW